MNTLYRLVWRGLRARPWQTILSVAAVALGTASVIAMDATVQSLRAGLLQTEESRLLLEGLMGQFDPFVNFVVVAVMLVAGFLVFNAFAMSITQRRQQIGALRTLGFTRAQVRRLLVGEALVIGVSGTLIGLAVGPLLGKLINAGMTALLGQYFVLEDTHADGASFIMALALGIGVTLLAVLGPAQRALRIPPLAVLRPPEDAALDGVSRRRTTIGLALAAALLVFAVLFPPAELVALNMEWIGVVVCTLVWLVALVLLLPAVTTLAARIALRFGAVGRIASDNLRRAQGRATLTVLAVVLALLAITSITGVLDFMFNRLMLRNMSGERPIIYTGRFDPGAGWANIFAQGLDSLFMSPEEVQRVAAVAGDRASVTPTYFAVVPELSFLGDAYFTIVMAPDAISLAGDTMFTFTEGDWATALPLMRDGCGVLITPGLAARNAVGLGDTLDIAHESGVVPCVVAGVGRTYANASLMSLSAAPLLGLERPILAFMIPHPGVDADALQAELVAALPDLAVNQLAILVSRIGTVMDLLKVALSSMLLLALLTAGMGIANTMLMSVSERRREVGLLRAVGATRAQVRAAILGEAALIGLAGAVAGLLAGAGFAALFVLAYGGRSWGVALDLRATALDAALLALAVGAYGLVSAPLIAALAAWLPARGILRETPVDTLALR